MNTRPVFLLHLDVYIFFLVDRLHNIYCSIAAVSHAPPPAPVQGNSGGSMLGGLGATIAQGTWISIYSCKPFIGHDHLFTHITRNNSGLLFVFWSLLFAGMAFGTGSGVAHRAVDAVMGPRTIQHETVVSEAASAPAPTANSMGSDACSMHSKAFQDVCRTSFTTL